MGAGHARSRYLNRKEGGAEGRASDWSEVVTSFTPKKKGATSELNLEVEAFFRFSTVNHMDSSMCSSAPDPEMWIIQGTLAWRTPPVRTGV
ncbi:unnamed protein product [Arabidopsis halleri]